MNSLIDYFESQVRKFRSIRETFENIEDFQIEDPHQDVETEDINLVSFAPTYRERLILDLQYLMVEHSDLMIDFTSIKGLSRLLFGEDTFISQNFWHDRTVDPNIIDRPRTIDRRPELYNLLRIKLMTRTWTTTAFENEGMRISSTSLEQLRIDVVKKIDEFIFKNPYRQDYIVEQPTRGRGALVRSLSKESLHLEYDVISMIWLANAIYDDNPSLTFEDISNKKILSNYLTSYLSKGNRDIPRSALKAYATELVKFYRETLSGTHQNQIIKISQDEKLAIYETAFKQIFTYMKEKKISFVPSPFNRRVKFTTDSRYNTLWYNKLMKSYHNVFMFTNQLGFDPLTFTPLQGGDPNSDGIFGTYYVNGVPLARYRRHHIDPSLKESLFLQDLFLTDNKLHGTYEKIARDHGVQYVYNLKAAFGELVSSQQIIGENEIESVFNKYGVIEVYEQYWKANPKFSNYLKSFNNRKQILHDQGMDQFFEDMSSEYPYLYNKFYFEFKQDATNNHRMLMLLVKPSTSGRLDAETRDYVDFLATDYYFSQYPKLVDYFNYKPHIFKYWFGD